MPAAPASRRAFLAASASAAAIALAPAVLVAAPSCRPDERPELLLAAQITALLDRPNPVFFGEDRRRCDCADCETIRRADFECERCGYRGSVTVDPCECADGNRWTIEFCDSALARLDAGETLSSDYPPRETLQRWRDEARSKPNYCGAQTDDRTRTNCGHGITWCPTCGASPTGNTEGADPACFHRTLRDLRALLARVQA